MARPALLVLFVIVLPRHCWLVGRTEASELNSAFPRIEGMATPLHCKQLARGQFETAHADLQTLAQARLEAARIIYETEFQEFLRGRGTLAFLLDSLRRLLDAERAVHSGNADRRAALESYYEHARWIEQVNKERYEVGRIWIPDYLGSTYVRLEAEGWLAESRAKPTNGRAAAAPLARNAGADALQAKDLAKAKFLSRAGGDELKRAKVRTARTIYAAREKEFMFGRGIQDFLLEAARRLLEAEQASSPREADHLSALEKYWEQARQNEAVNRQRFVDGRIPMKEYAESRYSRVEAEIRLARARGLDQKPHAGLPSVPEAEADPFWEAKELAKAKFQASNPDLKELALAKLQAAEISYGSRLREFLAGRGAMHFLLAAARRVLESFGDVHPDNKDRLAALHEYWKHIVQIEMVTKQRFEEGRVSLRDYQMPRYARLEAEIQLARPRARKEQPPTAPDPTVRTRSSPNQ
jgi:hypothetical protein